METCWFSSFVEMNANPPTALCLCPSFLRPLKVRKINDQLMLLDRAFLDPLAFPNKYAFRYE